MLRCLVDNMALSRQARLSLSTFLGGALACMLPLTFSVSQTTSYLWDDFAKYIFVLYGVLYNGILVLVYMQERDIMYKKVRALCSVCFPPEPISE